jgi:hypothetical protein
MNIDLPGLANLTDRVVNLRREDEEKLAMVGSLYLYRYYPLPSPLPKGEGASSLSLWGRVRVGESVICINTGVY